MNVAKVRLVESVQSSIIETETRVKDEYEAKLSDLYDLIESIQEQSQSLELQLNESQQAYIQLSSEMNEQLQLNDKLTDELTVTSSELANSKTELASTKDELDNMSERLAKANTDVMASNIELDSVKSVLNDKLVEVNVIKEDYNALTNELRETKLDLNHSQFQLDELTSELSVLKSEYNGLREQLALNRGELNDSNEKMSRTQSDLEESRIDNSKLASSVKNVQSELTAAQSEVETLSNLLTQLRIELSQKNEEIISLCTSNSRLKGSSYHPNYPINEDSEPTKAVSQSEAELEDIQSLHSFITPTNVDKLTHEYFNDDIGSVVTFSDQDHDIYIEHSVYHSLQFMSDANTYDGIDSNADSSSNIGSSIETHLNNHFNDNLNDHMTNPIYNNIIVTNDPHIADVLSSQHNISAVDTSPYNDTVTAPSHYSYSHILSSNATENSLTVASSASNYAQSENDPNFLILGESHDVELIHRLEQLEKDNLRLELEKRECEDEIKLLREQVLLLTRGESSVTSQQDLSTGSAVSSSAVEFTSTSKLQLSVESLSGEDDNEMNNDCDIIAVKMSNLILESGSSQQEASNDDDSFNKSQESSSSSSELISTEKSNASDSFTDSFTATDMKSQESLTLNEFLDNDSSNDKGSELHDTFESDSGRVPQISVVATSNRIDIAVSIDKDNSANFRRQLEPFLSTTPSKSGIKSEFSQLYIEPYLHANDDSK